MRRHSLFRTPLFQPMVFGNRLPTAGIIQPPVSVRVRVSVLNELRVSSVGEEAGLQLSVGILWNSDGRNSGDRISDLYQSLCR